LGHAEPTIRNRLSRARKLLRQRLARRGISLMAALATASLSLNKSIGAVPRSLTAAAVKAAAHLAAGNSLTTGLIPANVVALVEGASKAMVLTKCKAIILLLMTLGLIGSAFGFGALQRLPAQAPAESQKPAQKMERGPGPQSNSSRHQPSEDNGPVKVTGRVLDPDGTPVAGANVAVWATSGRDEECLARGTTAKDGGFQVTVTRPGRLWRAKVVASAPRLGPDWKEVLDPEKGAPITLRLAKDDVPVVGHILDLEGKPVAGASVQAVKIGRAPKGLATWAKKNVEWLTSHHYNADGLDSVSASSSGTAKPATTDRVGQFCLSGFGRDRGVVLDVRGPGIERRLIWVVMLQDPPKELAETVGLYGPRFQHLAGPAKPVSGTVIDKATGKPLAGVRVFGRVPTMGYARGWDIEAVTDDKGHYHLEGLPKADEYFITVDTLDGLTYLPQEKAAADTEALKPLRVDFALDRGTTVEGRLIDQESGKPVRGSIIYFPLPGSSQFHSTVKDKLGSLILAHHPVADDGTFKLLVFPGPGVVCGVGAYDKYVRARVSPDDAKIGVGQSILTVFEEMHAMVEMNGHAYRVITPGDQPESLKFDLKLGRGESLRGSFSAKTDRGLKVQFAKFQRAGAYDIPIQTAIDERKATFTASRLDPHQANLLVFYDEQQKLVGHVESQGGAKEPVTIPLEPWSHVQGRILDTENRLPPAGTTVQVVWRDSERHYRHFQTGPLSVPAPVASQGRFQIEGLVPGLPFELHVQVPLGGELKLDVHSLNVMLKGGETRDLGEIKVKSFKVD
jgi:hypothetical protein